MVAGIPIASEDRPDRMPNIACKGESVILSDSLPAAGGDICLGYTPEHATSAVERTARVPTGADGSDDVAAGIRSEGPENFTQPTFALSEEPMREYLKDWEPEITRPRPESDLALADAQIATQVAISCHVGTDGAAAWDEFRAELPARAAPVVGRSPRPPQVPREAGKQRPTDASSDAISGKRSSRLARALRDAATLDVIVERTRAGKRDITLVRLPRAADDLQRELIQALLALGFRLWPGKGYWR